MEQEDVKIEEKTNKILAVIKNPYCKPEKVLIEPGLSTLQNLVKGIVEGVSLPKINDVFGYCNDEGLLIGLEPNFYRPEWKDAIFGPVVFVGAGEEGDNVSLTDEQAKKIIDYLERNSVKDFGEFFYHIETRFEHYPIEKEAEL